MSDTEKSEKAATPEAVVRDLETEIRQKVFKQDPRYSIEAYKYIDEALDYTQHLLGRDKRRPLKQRHVSGRELLDGIRRHAIEHFGPLARTVFSTWGVRRTEDFGEIVFNLVANDLLGKTDADSRDDFANGYDFREAFDGPIEL